MRNNLIENWILRLILIAIGLGWFTACTAAPMPTLAPPQTLPAAASQPILAPTMALPTVTSQPALIPTPASPTLPAHGLAVAGTYPLGSFGVKLQVAADGTAVLYTPATRLLKAANWNGVWVLQNNGAVITITSTATGTPLTSLPAIKVDVVSDTLQVTAFGVNGEFYDRAEWGFALTNGLKHPQVAVLSRLLAKVPYLDYTVPITDTDQYTEQVRRAVARFQATEGLVSSGVATPETWLRLLSGVYANVPTSPVKFQIMQDVVNVRSGPDTRYTIVDRRYKGDVLDVVGKVSGATTQSTWLQTCCSGSDRGWVESDLGAATGSLDQVPEIPPDQLPPVPTPAPTVQRNSSARAGHPLLADLPSHTADGHPIAYFTFDDGPNGSYTQQMLSLIHI